MEYPKLRPAIEVFPAEMSNQRVLCLRDSLNYTDKVVFLPMESYHLIRLFDGQHSLLDIQAEHMRKFGELLFREQIEELVQQLDNNLLLESEQFQAHKDKLVSEFKASPVRGANLAGKSYPAEPERLAEELKGYFSHPEGPGGPEIPEHRGLLKGAVIPHIDYPRGGPTYAWAYREVTARPPADVYVILGTAHNETSEPYVLTAKDFATPLGTLKTDGELVQMLSEECGPEISADELTHRSEHSVELQTAFLKYARGDRNDMTILPVLCGSFHRYVTGGTAPDEDRRVAKFTGILKEYIAGSGKKVCVIASADLSHMGPRFGDLQPISPADLKWIANEDLETLQIVETGEADELFCHIARDKDRRRICGLPAIYTMLKIIHSNQGKLLKYSQWADKNATVTFASMVFT